MQYFYATYETREGEHEYTENGVLSAQSPKQAERKAKKARRLFTRVGGEEFCEYDGLMEISIVDYLVLKKYLFNIDRYFGEDGELRQ
jgi:hypothetical protein